MVVSTIASQQEGSRFNWQMGYSQDRLNFPIYTSPKNFANTFFLSFHLSDQSVLFIGWKLHPDKNYLDKSDKNDNLIASFVRIIHSKDSPDLTTRSKFSGSLFSPFWPVIKPAASAQLDQLGVCSRSSTAQGSSVHQPAAPRPHYWVSHILLLWQLPNGE